PSRSDHCLLSSSRSLPAPPPAHTLSLPDALPISEHDIDRLFRALADTTRRDILRRTLVGDASVSTLASYYDMSFAAVQKHVAILQEARSEERRVGNERR